MKDRRGEALSYADLSHYERLVLAIYESLQLIDEIDDVQPVVHRLQVVQPEGLQVAFGRPD